METLVTGKILSILNKQTPQIHFFHNLRGILTLLV